MIARSYCDETLPNSRRQTVVLTSQTMTYLQILIRSLAFYLKSTKIITDVRAFLDKAEQSYNCNSLILFRSYQLNCLYLYWFELRTNICYVGFDYFLIIFQTNKDSSQIRAAIPYLTDQIRAKVSLTLICSGLPLLD